MNASGLLRSASNSVMSGSPCASARNTSGSLSRIENILIDDDNEHSSEYRLGSPSSSDTSRKSQNLLKEATNSFAVPDEEYQQNLVLRCNVDQSASKGYLESSSSRQNSLNSNKTQSILSYSAKILRYIEDRYYFPYFTIFISLVNWTIFLWFGYEVGYNNIKEMAPIIPTDTSLWFITCTQYPQCHFLKFEAWRLLTYSLCHSGWLHITSNTIFILGYAAILEPLCENGLLLAVSSYISGVLFGALGHNLLEPFTGIVGASAGAYGVFGSLAAVSVLDKTSLMIHKFQSTIRFAVLSQLIFEVIYPVFSYNPSISYSSHFFGFIFGLMISTNIIVFTHRKSFTKSILLISALTLFATSFVLIYCYSVRAINVGFYVPFAAPSSCCGDMYHLEAKGTSLNTIRDEYFCHNDALKEFKYHSYYDTQDDDNTHNNQNSNGNFVLPTRSPFSSFEESVYEPGKSVVKIS